MTQVRRAAIVTGAATGVGAASACWLAARGFDVIVNFNSSADAALAVVEHCRASGMDAHAVRGDVSKEDDCRRVAAVALERYGRIDALVNSAGTTQIVPMSDLDAINTEDFERVFAVNAVGAFQMARAVSSVMRRSGGAIVNVSSVGSTTGSGSSYAYVASKGALNALTIALARHLAPEIRVNAVLPGLIEGRWLEDRLGPEAYERAKSHYAANSALGRVSTPQDIAEAIGWLIVAAPVMTGQLVCLDAGLTLGRPLALAR
jgi:3-oxoacyl-[acyl-carrier protein] reductase